MKMMSFAVALLASATAWGAEPCQAELRAYGRALDRAAKARQDLANYENSALSPLVPEQVEKERQHYQDNLEAALEDVKRTSDAHDRCVKRKSCKKWKPGWHCTVAGTYEECCIDKGK